MGTFYSLLLLEFPNSSAIPEVPAISEVTHTVAIPLTVITSLKSGTLTNTEATPHTNWHVSYAQEGYNIY